MKNNIALIIILLMISVCGFSQTKENSKNWVIDTTFSEELQDEENFQTYLDTLIEEIDGADMWDNLKINCGRFNAMGMDTIRVVLVDSTQHWNYRLPMSNFITSNFGARHKMFHYGVDIKLNVGDSVKAALDGVVRICKYDPKGYGNVLVLRHLHGIETIYGHLSKTFVEVNQVIKAGDIIGLGGSTGHSTGPHLHLEIRYKGAPINPNYIIDFQTGKLRSNNLILTRANFDYPVKSYVESKRKCKSASQNAIITQEKSNRKGKGSKNKKKTESTVTTVSTKVKPSQKGAKNSKSMATTTKTKTVISKTKTIAEKSKSSGTKVKSTTVKSKTTVAKSKTSTLTNKTLASNKKKKTKKQ